jgi:PAS domain S-box-containing protein
MSSFVERFQSRLQNLKQRTGERDEIVRAIQAGDVDSLIVLQKGGATVYPVRSEEPLYRSIIEELPVPVATMLTDGTFVYVNQAMQLLLGAEARDLVSQSIVSRVATADRGPMTAMLKKALHAPVEDEITVLLPEGDRKMLFIASRLDISGVDAVALVVADVSDHVLRRVNETAVTVKDQMLAAVSQELRTPLISMLSWVQVLEYQFREDERAMHDLLNLKNAIHSQIRIVSDLLDLAQAERRAVRFEVQTFDIRRSILTAVEFVTLAANNKRITIRADLPVDPLLIDGDPDRVGQVMLQLLTNAVKFSRTDGQVAVRAVQTEKSIEVTVTDDGVGIAPHVLPFVFEPFRRDDAVRESPGLGVGLATTRRLIEAHGGTIRAASDGEDKGATFLVQLPLAIKLRA